MPWKEQDVEKLRFEFVLRALGESTRFVDLCREYGIETKTGYKWRKRFLEEGRAGLADRSRRPNSSPGQLSEREVCEIVRLKHCHPKWGPRKIRDLYARSHPRQKLPSESSFKRVLRSAGLVKKRKKRRSRDSGRIRNRQVAEKPNQVWTVDFKGWWYTPQGERCEPLTVRDDYSRYVLCASLPANARTGTVRVEFERLFDKYGLPESIRSDNGRPFAVSTAPLGLSQLSAWWLALGIDLDRIDPGCPAQNGAHERMHRDIAQEVQGRIEGNLRLQAQALEIWRKCFNRERPHEALAMQRPAEVYRKSKRRFGGTPDNLEYPFGYLQRKVASSGKIRLRGASLLISSALRGWNVGLKPQGGAQYSVYFAALCLGRIDLSSESFQVTSCSPRQTAADFGAKRPPATPAPAPPQNPKR